MDSGQYHAAEQALGTLIAVEPNSGAAHRKLGIAYLRLQKFRQAEWHLSQASRLDACDWNAFDGLAETYGHLNERGKARLAGRQALSLKDASVPSAEGSLAPPRLNGSRIVAFSLFGGHPRYCETAVLNAAAAPRLLPGWICRFYVDATVPLPVLDRLRALGSQIVMVGGTERELPGTMWRFLALDDPAAGAIICRDADSLVNARDAGFVLEWIDSGMPFHIIRDYFPHSELILAGLFGARSGVLGVIRGKMRHWLIGSGPAGRWTDQHFLRACIWPLVRDAALTHDTWFGYGTRVMAGAQPAGSAPDHVGANHGRTTMALKLDHPDGSAVRWTLLEASGQPVCSYDGTIHDKRHLTEIPHCYGTRVQSGEWKVQWTVTPTMAPARVTPAAD